MEKAVILDGSKWQLQQLTYEVWHYRTATASLRFQVRYSRHRHVILKIQEIEPALVAVHGAGPKSRHLVFAAVFVDLRHSLPKLLSVLIEPAIVIKVVDV